MTSRTRVLVMSNHVDGIGGAESVTRGLAVGLAERGHEVSLRGVSPVADDDRVDLGPLAALGVSTGFLTDDPDPGGRAGRRTRAAWRRDALDSLRRTLADHEDGVLVCAQVWTMELVAELGLDAVMRRGTRIIGQYHASFEAARAGRDYGRLSRTYRNLDKFLLLTRADAEEFRRLNFNNTGWMPNALPADLDRDLDGDVASSAGEGGRERLVSVIARYDENKQLDHVLRAWAQVAPARPGWRLELYGEGPLRGSLEALVGELGLEGSARLMGVTHDVPAVLRRSAVSVLSSRTEGLPLVLAESLACGAPAISYDSAPGVREIVTDGVDGVVVRRGHVDELAGALAGLLDDEPRRRAMGEAGRRSARRFARATVLDQWEDLLARVLR
ncbi:glycosyltransferase [Oryzobacter sp. R7]|uniref:glycosyltransferase n=1 Tax=Oryzobacter faecalis TaxID=3388656 RepID=UPI00398CC0F2